MPNDPKLDNLEERLKKAESDFTAEYNPLPKNSQSMGDGAKAGVELVGGLIGGGILGYALDHFFGTSPILFIIFLFLGVITGFYNIYKITKNMGTSVGFKPLPNDPKNATQGRNFNDDEED